MWYIFTILKNDDRITRSFIIFVIIFYPTDFFFFLMTVQPNSWVLTSPYEVKHYLIWSEETFSTVTMQRVITALSEDTETTKYFSYFSNNFSKAFTKIDEEISQNIHLNIRKFLENIPHVFSNFLLNFSKILKKPFRYLFIISIISIIPIKLLGCILIIFPKLI